MSLWRQKFLGLRNLLSARLLTTLTQRLFTLGCSERWWLLLTFPTLNALPIVPYATARISFSGRGPVLQEIYTATRSDPAAKKVLAVESAKSRKGMKERYQWINIDDSAFHFLCLSRASEWCRLHCHRKYGWFFFSTCRASKIFSATASEINAEFLFAPKEWTIKYISRRRSYQRLGGVSWASPHHK